MALVCSEMETAKLFERSVEQLWVDIQNLDHISITRDSKLARDGLGLQGNRQGKNYCTLGFELLGRNIAPLNFKTERVAETALRIW